MVFRTQTPKELWALTEAEIKAWKAFLWCPTLTTFPQPTPALWKCYTLSRGFSFFLGSLSASPPPPFPVPICNSPLCLRRLLQCSRCSGTWLQSSSSWGKQRIHLSSYLQSLGVLSSTKTSKWMKHLRNWKPAYKWNTLSTNLWRWGGNPISMEIPVWRK